MKLKPLSSTNYKCGKTVNLSMGKARSRLHPV